MITAATLALLAWAPATLAAAPTSPDLNVYYETDPGGVKFTASLTGVHARGYTLLATVDGKVPMVLGYAHMGDNISFVVPQASLDALNVSIELSAAFYRDHQFVFTEPADLVLGVASDCEVLDFNHTIGDDSVMVAGKSLSNEWADIGMNISALNSRMNAPDLAILFDSGNPTGDDDDLATPNPGGVGNDSALGHVLIIAEDDVDAVPNDGLIDDPDDEAFGGSLFFDFDDPTTICSVSLLDIDEMPGTELRFYRNGDLVNPDETLSILSLGDGSYQRVDFLEADVDRFEVFFRGSGAVGGMELLPCPQLINFDETSTGMPLSFSAGETITDQFASIGLNITTFNKNNNHPDKAILFDSENPTGDDDDLLTPNPMVPGNDTPLGLVLIVAEDDVDVNPADGLVDDPDDEAAGGRIIFRFDFDVTIISARVLDVDANEVDFWRFLDANDNEIQSIVIPDAPDGNVQFIQANVSGVRRAILDLGGSGAITRLRFCPDTP
ncbi:MAG: hypothetical protein ACI8TQ_001420 [Planctomycetota bacterium]|jgi:hypothetical protein